MVCHCLRPISYDLIVCRDAPNAWPPHQHIILEALAALPSNVTSGTIPIPNNNQSTFDLIPSGQIGVSEDQLPGQLIIGAGGNATKTGPSADVNRLNGTVVNGGNATEGESWGEALQRELANRYFASAFCSWYVTLADVGTTSMLTSESIGTLLVDLSLTSSRDFRTRS